MEQVNYYDKISVDPTINWERKPTEEEQEIIKKVVYGIAQDFVDMHRPTLNANRLTAEISEPELEVVANAFNVGYKIFTHCKIEVFRKES